MFPADLLPLVLITLVMGYADHEHNYFSAETMFAIAITSIIPLSYYIGMGIARLQFFFLCFRKYSREPANRLKSSLHYFLLQHFCTE